VELSTFTQVLSGYTGLVASLFFAFGIVTQNTQAMVDMSRAYFGLNPSTILSLSHQKADYLIGFVGLFITFLLQISSYLVPHFTSAKINLSMLEVTSYLVPAFALLFIMLRLLAKHLAKGYEQKIKDLFKRIEEERLAKGS